jgi:hypothetical protein
LFEEFGRDPPGSRLVSDMLGAIFAKLGVGTFAIRFRPGTTGTIESTFLVQVQEGPQSTANTHFAPRNFSGLHNGRNPAGDFATALDLHQLSFFRRLSV